MSVEKAVSWVVAILGVALNGVAALRLARWLRWGDHGPLGVWSWDSAVPLCLLAAATILSLALALLLILRPRCVTARLLVIAVISADIGFGALYTHACREPRRTGWLTIVPCAFEVRANLQLAAAACPLGSVQHATHDARASVSPITTRSTGDLDGSWRS
jgi:hypothetical protein